MKLKPQADLAAFLDAVGQCRSDVHFNTAEGDSLNLRSVLSQYVFAALAGSRNCGAPARLSAMTPPIFCGCMIF